MASGNIEVIKPTKDFEMIPGSIIRELSPEIIGIYCKVISFGQDWKLNIKGLSVKTGISEGKLRNAFKLLVERGIVERRPDHTNGRLNGWKYVFHGEISIAQNSVFKKISNTENAEYCENSVAENSEDNIYILDSNNILKSNTPIHKSKVSPAFDFRKNLIEIGVAPAVADAWMQVRKTKRATNTEIAFNALRREISNAGLTANDAITICVENSWGGFKAEYVAPKGRTSCAATQQPEHPNDWYHHNMEVARQMELTK